MPLRVRVHDRLAFGQPLANGGGLYVLFGVVGAGFAVYNIGHIAFHRIRHAVIGNQRASDKAGVRTPPRTPTANSLAERIVRTIRTECLDHLIVIDERHLRAVLAEYADYYNRDRPHRSLWLKTPLPSPVLVGGRVVSRPVLGGLHHVYARAA